MVDKYKLQEEDMQSMNLNTTTLDKLRQLLPEVFTENNTGNLQIDIEKLKIALGGAVDIEEDNQTRYSFLWSGKKQAQLEANKPTTATLRPCIKESKNWDDTQNVYIEGDNLEVLKLLQKSYYGKVKMIYIDPPYNTGKDFIYKDNYHDNMTNYLQLTGQVDDNGNRATTNSDINGRYHTDWLNMMYPRLKLARNLLREDGVIFISIDDNEVHNLRKVCDEIFGEDNFVTKFIYEKTQHFGRQQLNYFSNVEYIVCYAKELKNTVLKPLLIERIQTSDEFDDAPLYNASNNNSFLEFPVGTVKFNLIDGVYSSTTDDKVKLMEPVTVKNSYNINPLRLQFKSRWSQSKINEQIDLGATFIIKSNSFSVRVIYGADKSAKVPPKQLIFTNKNNPLCAYNKFGRKVGVNENASAELKTIFDDLDSTIFDYSKTTSLIGYLVSLIQENNDLVLDFFSGSATTAHAVMQLNAEDGGKRKYICVQLPETTKEDSEAYKAGYKNICEIGKERIRRAGDKILAEFKAKHQPNDLLFSDGSVTGEPDIGFKVFKLDTSNIKPFKNEDLLSLDLCVDNRSSLDLFYELVLKQGYTLEHKQVIIEVGGTKCYALLGIDKVPFVLAVLDDMLKDDFAIEILKYPLSLVIIKDSCFISDELKLNTLATLEQLQSSGNVLSHVNELQIRII